MDTAATTTASPADSGDTAGGPPPPLPPILGLVFGLPVFFVIAWFFLQFLSADQRRAKSALDALDAQDAMPGEEERG